MSYVFDSNSIQVLNHYAAKAPDGKSRNTGELGKDDFLNLLITQLQYQDPLNPQSDQDFIAQMAQFSALEQMQNMTKAMGQMQAYSLIGKYIMASEYDRNIDDYTVISGLVENVRVTNGMAYLVVNGRDVTLENVITIADSDYNTPLDDRLSQYTGYLGYEVKAAVFDSSEGKYVSVTGRVVELAKGVFEDYAVLDGVKASLSGLYPTDDSFDDEYIAQYLVDNVGKEISIFITDMSSGSKVPVRAILRDFEVDEDGNPAVSRGIFNITLDNVITPVDSVVSVRENK